MSAKRKAGQDTSRWRPLRLSLARWSLEDHTESRKVTSQQSMSPSHPQKPVTIHQHGVSIHCQVVRNKENQLQILKCLPIRKLLLRENVQAPNQGSGAHQAPPLGDPTLWVIHPPPYTPFRPCEMDMITLTSRTAVKTTVN